MNNNNSKQEIEINISQLLRYCLKKRKMIIIYASIGIIIGLIISFSLPKYYTSSITMVYESKSKMGMSNSAGAFASFMGISNIAEENGINEKIYPAIIRSTPFLLEFANIEVESRNSKIPFYKYLLLDQKMAWWDYLLTPSKLFSSNDNKDLNFYEDPKLQYAYCETLGKALKIISNEKEYTYVLEIKTQDPEISHMLADTILNTLQYYVNNYKTQKTRANLESSLKKLETSREAYYKAEQAYALAMDRNQNLISRTVQISIDRLKNEQDLAFQIYQQIATQVEADKIKLQEESVIATIIEPAKIPIYPTSPNKKIIVAGFTLLFSFIGVLIAIISFFKTKN